jgi:hypothetical protein
LNFLSIDPGKNSPIACWKNDKLVEVVRWEFIESIYYSQNLSDFLCLVSKLITDMDAEAVVLERPPRTFPVQFIIYSDCRMLAKRRKIDFVAYPAKKVKKISSGNGLSTKDDMMSSLLLKNIYSKKKILKMSDHEVDSIMIGICFMEDLGRKSKKINKKEKN